MDKFEVGSEFIYREEGSEYRFWVVDRKGDSILVLLMTRAPGAKFFSFETFIELDVSVLGCQSSFHGDPSKPMTSRCDCTPTEVTGEIQLEELSGLFLDARFFTDELGPAVLEGLMKLWDRVG